MRGMGRFGEWILGEKTANEKINFGGGKAIFGNLFERTFVIWYIANKNAAVPARTTAVSVMLR